MQKQILALATLGLSATLGAAQSNCAPTPAATCYPDHCACHHCLGPDLVNPPVNPVTCNGDLAITVAGFYWNAHQDGMEYAIDDAVAVTQTAGESTILGLNNLIDAEHLTPKFDWDFGFKLGLAYAGCHDGWDIGVLWTWFKGNSDDHTEAEFDDNHTLLPLWSSYAPSQGLNLYATDIKEEWTLQLNLIDIELGREFWTSKYLSLRPFIGLRVAFIDQDFDMEFRGGSWGGGNDSAPDNAAVNGFAELDNNFKGAGARIGLDSTWHLGCGWGVYGNLAASIVHGRFDITHDEYLRLPIAPFNKRKLFETSENFRVSRGMLDLGLGLQWETLFCECEWAFTLQLGYENHMFFNQNQMWRVVRVGDLFNQAPPNDTGENVFHQRRGDLDTQGWTLRFKLAF